MRGWMLSVLWCVAFMAVGCGSPYKADYEPDHDFSSYHSYRWLEPNEPQLDALAGNPLLKRRFIKAGCQPNLID